MGAVCPQDPSFLLLVQRHDSTMLPRVHDRDTHAAGQQRGWGKNLVRSGTVRA